MTLVVQQFVLHISGKIYKYAIYDADLLTLPGGKIGMLAF